MAAHHLRSISVSILLALGAISNAQGALITSFQGALQSGTPAPGWSYLWNNAGPIGDPANYTALLPTAGGLYTSDGTDTLPASPPANFIFIGPIGGVPRGHPGVGAAQAGSGAVERYAIAAYTISESDKIAIQNSSLVNVNPNSGGSLDGLNVKVFVNNDPLPRISTGTAAGFQSSVQFDVSLGNLLAGDTIYVAVGSKNVDFFDGFSLQYDIVRVPEPSCLCLIAVATALGSLRARNARRRQYR